MKQKSWISIVFSFASQCRGKIVLSVLCAIISVVAGLIPYWSVYQIITLFIGGSPVMAEVWRWCCDRTWRLMRYASCSMVFQRACPTYPHIPFWRIFVWLLPSGLMKAPLGTVIGESVGKLKNVLVDRVKRLSCRWPT